MKMKPMWIVALPLVAACGMSEIKAQNEAMQVQQARNAAAAQEKQDQQNANSFRSLHDSLETAYRSSASRLEMSEADWTARASAVPASKRDDPRFTVAANRHQQIAAEMQALATRHSDLDQWATGLAAPTAQDSQKLAQGYTSLQQKQQLLMGDYGSLQGAVAQLGR